MTATLWASEWIVCMKMNQWAAQQRSTVRHKGPRMFYQNKQRAERLLQRPRAGRTRRISLLFWGDTDESLDTVHVSQKALRITLNVNRHTSCWHIICQTIIKKKLKHKMTFSFFFLLGFICKVCSKEAWLCYVFVYKYWIVHWSVLGSLELFQASN